MDPNTLGTIAETLRITGPWGIVVVLGWFYWRTASAKDSEIKNLYNRISELTGRQTKAILDVRDAINDLRETIVYSLLRAKSSTPPKSGRLSADKNNV